MFCFQATTKVYKAWFCTRNDFLQFILIPLILSIMSGLLNSGLNGSSSNLPDTTGRSFTTSFSAQSGSAAAFNHLGTIQGLHNIHGSFNIPNMPGSLASRNSTINGGHPGGIQQPAGSLSNGRFPINHLPTALSQLSHASSHGHPGVTNRGGSGVSPMLGNTGPRITSSIGNLAGGGNIGRSLSSGGGLAMPGLASHLSLISNGSGNMGIQGSNRLMGGVLSQAPQVISMLGNSYSSVGGLRSQNQVQAGNNHLTSMALLKDLSVHENAPFDINDFPQLTAHPNSAGSSQGQLGSLRKQSVGVVHQNQEFSIQNEDFPALPGFKGGNTDFPVDSHRKEQLHDSAVSMMQSQHFPMGRSGGFNLGVPYSSHLQQQQQHASSVGSGGPPSISLRPMNSSNTISGVGPYDQLIQQYQQLQSQSQFRMGQMSAVGPHGDQDLKSQSPEPVIDEFGLRGLLKVIRMNNPDLTSLALGIDLTTLGLNLNASDDLHKRFASPWAEEPHKGEPQYSIPECYYAKQPPVLNQAHFAKLHLETLFYIFYSMPREEAQLYAAHELHARGWFYHKEQRLWLTRNASMKPLVETNSYERGSYLCFDPNTWETACKDNFILQFEMIEKKPDLPQH